MKPAIDIRCLCHDIDGFGDPLDRPDPTCSECDGTGYRKIADLRYEALQLAIQRTEYRSSGSERADWVNRKPYPYVVLAEYRRLLAEIGVEADR